MPGPTNADIMREIKTINKIVSDHEERIKPLEHWKIAYDAANEALTHYRAEHKTSTLPRNNINKDFINVVLKFIGVIGTLLGIIYLILDKYV